MRRRACYRGVSLAKTVLAARRNWRPLPRQGPRGRNPRRPRLVLRRAGERQGPRRDRAARWPTTGAAAVVKRVGCVGMCHQTPLVELIPAGRRAVEGFCPRAGGAMPRRSCFRTSSRKARGGGSVHRASRLARSLAERRDARSGDRPARSTSATGRSARFSGRRSTWPPSIGGQIDPTDLDEYLRHDGFEALRHCIEGLSPEEIIEEIRTSGLRGRGGAGFPTGAEMGRRPRRRVPACG